MNSNNITSSKSGSAQRYEMPRMRLSMFYLGYFFHRDGCPWCATYIRRSPGPPHCYIFAEDSGNPTLPNTGVDR